MRARLERIAPAAASRRARPRPDARARAPRADPGRGAGAVAAAARERACPPHLRPLRERHPAARAVHRLRRRARARPRRSWSGRLATLAPSASDRAGAGGRRRGRRLRKAYGAVEAVAGRRPRGRRRRVLHAARPVGLGQDDDAPPDRRLRAPRRRPRSAAAATRSRRVRRTQRDVNTVFQDYALFPHMTVAENVGYGLRVRGVAARERGARGRRGAASACGSTGFGDRKPVQLSGGQRQRVALARVDRQPAAGAPPRRAARRARPEAPPGDAALPEGAPARARDDVRLRHARPGGGADDERPARRLQPRPDRAARDAGRGVRAAGDRVRRRLRRHLEHRRARRPPALRAAGADPDAFDRAAARANPATIDDVVFVGAFTRYLVADAGGELVVVQQTSDASHEALAAGEQVRLAWRREDAFELEKEGTVTGGMQRSKSHVACWSAVVAALAVPAASSGRAARAAHEDRQGRATLNMIAWEGYTQPQWVKPFEKQSGCTDQREVRRLLGRDGRADALRAAAASTTWSRPPATRACA